MPVLPKTPNVKTFTDAWTQKFGETVTSAAGKDGRLSRSEAAKIATRPATESLFADNATNYLNTTGQQTVSASKLIAESRAYAERAATAVAGPDGLVSYEDARKLPADLQADFLYLRGKGPIDAPSRTPEQLKADVSDLVLRALDAGAGTKLSSVPAELHGATPVATDLAHAPSHTRATAYVANDHVYISRASDAPSPLTGFYDLGALPAAGSHRAALRSAIESAAAGIDYMSETDSNVKYVDAPGLGSGSITADAIKSLLGSTHDTIMGSVFLPPQSDVQPLAGRSAEVRDAHAFLNQMSNNFDPADPASVANAGKWKALAAVLDANLTDLTLVRFGDINLSSFLVGRTKDGDLAGVLMGGVET